MNGPKKLGWLVWGGAAGAVGRSRWWGLRSPQWGQWVRRCAAPRQIQRSGLQRRAVCGSRWRTQRGHAVAGGWWYLWTDGGVGEMGAGGARMLLGVLCGACGARVCRASVVLCGWCVGVVGVPCWYVMG